MFSSHDDARARDVFLRALDLPVAQRAEWVRRVLHDRPDLAGRVTALVSDAEDVSTGHASEEIPLWFEPLLEVDHLGDYRILGVLGRGGMAVVLHAEQMSTGREMALKLLPPGVVSPALRDRLLREGRILSRLRHPSICRVNDWGVFDTPDGPRPYLALDLHLGTPLLEWVRRGRPSVERRLRVLEQIARAVDHAHDQGVVHRDLKPSNVVVDAQDHPCVLDFGVAKVVEGSGLADRTLTRVGQLVGTISYMSPEQALGRLDQIGPATDIYALGLLCFETLTLEKPYELPAPLNEALGAIATVRPRRPSSVDPRWRGDADAVCDRALQTDPRDRYANADELADDLRSLRQRRRVGARRGRWSRLRRRIKAVHVAAPVLVASTLVLGGLLLRSDRTARSELQSVVLALQEANENLHLRERNEDSILEAIHRLEDARSRLSAIPRGPYEPELQRFLSWRLGEAYYFLGSRQHDPEKFEHARGVWETVGRLPRSERSLAAIEPTWTIAADIRHISPFHGPQGVGLAHAELAQFGEPATHWLASLTARTQALERYTRERSDGEHRDWDALPMDPPDFELGLLLNEFGESQMMLGGVTGNAQEVRAALDILHRVEDRNLLDRDDIAHASLWFNLGRGHCILAELTGESADLTLASAWLDAAISCRTESRDPCVHAQTRRWQVRVDRQRALATLDPGQRAAWRNAGTHLARVTMERLGSRLDQLERSDLALAWGAIEIDAGLEGDEAAVRRAVSLLEEASLGMARDVRPPSHAEWLYQKARLERAWVSVDPAAGFAAKSRARRWLDEARSVLPRLQMTWLHALCDDEREAWESEGGLNASNTKGR